ncbi:MAG: phage holin family protein [Opitutales bacterium]
MNNSENNDINNRDVAFSKVAINRRIDLGFWKSLESCSVIALGILLSALIFPSAISFGNIFSFAGLAVLIWVLNFILRPFLVLFTLPFIIFTFGAGMILVNALVVWIASGIIPEVKFSSYLYAVFTAFIIEVVSWIVAIFKRERVIKRAKKKNDVIDV